MKNRKYMLVMGLFMVSSCAQILPPQPDDPYYAPLTPVEIPTAVNQPPSGTIFSLTNASYLFSDRKASRVGDLITVNLNERTRASKNADTEIKKDDSAELLAPTLAGRVPSYNGNPLGFSFDTKRQFKAEADSIQTNRLNGTITVTVAQVLDNGNMIIRGEKWFTLNQGSEFIRISGIIRPADIAPDNSISSTRIANARITYSGTGALDEANKIGWLSRFFNSSWFPI